MSFQEEWVLPKPVETYSSVDLVRRVRGLLPDGLRVGISGRADNRTIQIDLPAQQVDVVGAKLSKRDGQLDWNWRGEVDPPSSGDVYELLIDVVDDERPLLRIASNDGENRQGWPIVFSIASSLAEELGAIPEEEAQPPNDRIPMFIEPDKSSKPN